MASDAVEVSPTAPQFLRTVNGLSVKTDGSYEDVVALAEQQVGKIEGYDPENLNTVPDSVSSISIIHFSLFACSTMYCSNTLCFLSLRPNRLSCLSLMGRLSLQRMFT